MKTKSRIYEMGGVITEVNGDFCTLRLRLPAGVVSPDQLIAVGQIAQKYNLDNVHLTTRQTIEIPHIKITELEMVANELLANGHDIGAERTEVVNITACPGTDRCKLANIDSLHLAKEIDKRYFRKDMPGFGLHVPQLRQRSSIMTIAPSNALQVLQVLLGLDKTVHTFRIRYTDHLHGSAFEGQ